MKSHWLEQWENEQEEKIEELEERSAIMEYDGNMTRQDAETKALEQIEKSFNRNNGSK